jgi:hypothetical protein
MPRHWVIAAVIYNTTRLRLNFTIETGKPLYALHTFLLMAEEILWLELLWQETGRYSEWGDAKTKSRHGCTTIPATNLSKLCNNMASNIADSS